MHTSNHYDSSSGDDFIDSDVSDNHVSNNDSDASSSDSSSDDDSNHETFDEEIHELALPTSNNATLPASTLAELMKMKGSNKVKIYCGIEQQLNDSKGKYVVVRYVL